MKTVKLCCLTHGQSLYTQLAYFLSHLLGFLHLGGALLALLGDEADLHLEGVHRVPRPRRAAHLRHLEPLTADDQTKFNLSLLRKSQSSLLRVMATVTRNRDRLELGVARLGMRRGG